MKTNLETIPDLPINWEDCTKAQLQWLAEHGSYGQRRIAAEYLRNIAAQEMSWV